MVNMNQIELTCGHQCAGKTKFTIKRDCFSIHESRSTLFPCNLNIKTLNKVVHYFSNENAPN